MLNKPNLLTVRASFLRIKHRNIELEGKLLLYVKIQVSYDWNQSNLGSIGTGNERESQNFGLSTIIVFAFNLLPPVKGRRMVELLPKLLQGYIFCKYYGWRGEGGMVMGKKNLN